MESGHELLKLTTEAVTAWVAGAALLAAGAAAWFAGRQVIETRNSEKEADAQESFRSYLELAVNNPNLARPDLYPITDAIDRKKYEWFVAYLLAASEKILVSVDDPIWSDNIELNLRYHKKFLVENRYKSELKFYDPVLHKLISKVCDEVDQPAPELPAR